MKHTYHNINRHPTTRIEKQVTEAVKNLFQQDLIVDSIYIHINSRCSYPPQMYGLPKAHKDNVPMRPIVAVVGSPTHDLAKELFKFLAPLVGKTRSFVNNH